MKPSMVDAVTVGSGAAGSLLEAKLAEAGKQVFIWEAGSGQGMADLVSLATMTSVGEGLPVPKNRLALSERKDQHCLPPAHVVHDCAG